MLSTGISSSADMPLMDDAMIEESVFERLSPWQLGTTLDSAGHTLIGIDPPPYHGPTACSVCLWVR